MPAPKHREPLVKKAVVVAARQWDALEEKSREEERSVSYLVRQALDDYLEDDKAAESAPDAAPAEAVRR